MSKCLLSLFKKSNCGQIALITLYKKTTWANRSQFLLKRATSVICSLFKRIPLKTVFTAFSLFFCQRANPSVTLPSDTLPSVALFWRSTGVIPSCHSWKKSGGSSFLLFPSILIFCSQKTVNSIKHKHKYILSKFCFVLKSWILAGLRICSLVFQANQLFFVSERAICWGIREKCLCHFLSWVTGANRSRMLFCHDQQEQITPVDP